ncbi:MULTISPECIES: glycosyltransferase family 2 protein [Flavobacterium]|uniref:Glycosyltransferase family 2 protein n=2 Tax=Flavobacterium TaxID=237 RepID=A0A2N9P7Q5_9FLAO|nr:MULTISPECIES: glycosyltransferase [Flavobacterium]QYS89769.1 glycosyltransferase family 2 protein [Flavobacterium davisii]RVU91394.1 glycosyltransferase family 2 protein [Flavobacterium columnare]SPE76366.1 Poly-beta-1,6-N-acetyl-D-glucosamine synthase [Flavobacterium columnare]
MTDIFQGIIFLYASMLTIIYFILIIYGYKEIKKYKENQSKEMDENFLKTPFAPGISIVAPAYNEEMTIIDNVHSMMTLNYPKFEVVIVNDGSKDSTLELLIENFELVETPFAYVEKIKTKPLKRILKSTNPAYSKLTVVDKVNGGTKADASNAGINASSYPYFLCTDVDCILSRDALIKMIKPILINKTQVIGVGATLRMANSCVVQNGVVTQVKVPNRIIPLFQEVEYLRSYLIGKMGWSRINAIGNISGGLGMFDKSVVIAAGGYDPSSHAEDMDLTTRIIGYMCNFNKDYKIVQIPDTCCWTEGPPNIKILNRQRTRWARGLLQIFTVHRKYLFNPKYKQLGMITLPYTLFFEFSAPLIELVGYLYTVYLLIAKGINFYTASIMLTFVYLFGICLSLITIYLDRLVQEQYRTFGEYLKLCFFTLIEPFIYHPLIVFYSLKGYVDFLSRKKFEWGQMTRQGFAQNKTTTPAVENQEVE